MIKQRLSEILGYTLIIVGLIGFLIPIMPSVPFLLAGAALVGKDDPHLQLMLSKTKEIKEKLKNKFSKLFVKKGLQENVRETNKSVDIA
jgi:uncharacterized membrane protein YbaN (DUF454 family)